MNRRLFHSLCLLLFVLGPVIALSQPKLHINSVVSNPVDTVYWNNNSPIIAYTVVVENIGNNQLTGNCIIKFRYNQWTADIDKKSWQANNFEVGQTTIVTFQDTVFDLSSQRYKGGDNIIVIWPHSDNPAQAPDTTSHDIYITDMTGVLDPAQVAARVDVYPNPVADQLNIRYLDGKHRIECVRILGLDGKVYFASEQSVSAIDMGHLSSGLYFVEFKFKDGIYGALRVSKP